MTTNPTSDTVYDRLKSAEVLRLPAAKPSDGSTAILRPPEELVASYLSADYKTDQEKDLRRMRIIAVLSSMFENLNSRTKRNLP